MGSLSFAKGGVIKLPPGFRFQPTDEEIVFQYLLRKSFSCPLPASIIPEINVSRFNPWDLPDNGEQDRYFFSNKKARNQSSRASEGGYWKASGVDKQIVSSERKPLVGLRKTLVFYSGKPQSGTRTHWIMHEYRIILTRKAAASCSAKLATKPSHQRCSVQLGNWVLCHIFMRNGSPKAVNEIVKHCENYSIFNSSGDMGSTWSANSSVVTDDVYSYSSDDEDTSSHNIVLV